MEIEELRKMIDKADAMLLTSFITRMRVTAEIAEYKKLNGVPVFDPEREKEKLKEVEDMAPDDLSEECLSLYNKIMEISKDYQKKKLSD